MKILFLGDSITEGKPGVSYISMIQKNFKDIELINRGFGGDTVSSLYKRVCKMEDLDAFDHIVLFIGVNDVYGKLTTTYKILKTLTRQRWTKNSAVFNERYNKLVSLLKQKSPNIIIIPPLLIGEDINNKWNSELNKLINIVFDISKNRDIVYLDLVKTFKEYLINKPISNYLPVKITELLNDVKNLKDISLVDQKSQERGLYLTLDGVHINSVGALMISNAITSYLQDISSKLNND